MENNKEALKKQGEIIKEARVKKNYTQEELAELIGVSPKTLSRWEMGGCNIDEQSRKKLKEILEISRPLPCELYWQTEESANRTNKERMIKDIKDIKSIEELENLVDKFVEAIEYDQAFACTVRKMLSLLLFELLGFEIYYLDHCKKEYEHVDLGWDAIVEDLRDVIDKRDSYPIPHGYVCPPYFLQGQLSRKIQFMAFMIGSELFEDFDENGYRNGYVQQVGNRGESDGYDLLNLISEVDGSLMISFRTAVLALATYINRECC